MSRRISDTQDHDVEPFDCVEGGEKYRAFRSRSKRFLACKTDKSGSSLADAWEDNDMGGAGPLAVPLPGGGGGGAAAWTREMTAAQVTRRKGLWAWVVRHLSDKATQDILSQAPYFQNHITTIAYLDGYYDTPIRTTDLRKMNREWNAVCNIYRYGLHSGIKL